MQDKSTHILLEEDKLIISPNLKNIFIFLINIEKEIETFLGFKKRLEKINEQYLESLEIISVLAKKLEKNNIDFSYTLKEHPNTFIEKLEFSTPIRCESIVLFANLETIFCLYLAYEKETSEKYTLIQEAMKNNNITEFINNFLLTNKNDFYKKNRDIFSMISAKEIRKLRNELTHFFSVNNNIILGNIHIDKEEELQKYLKLQGHKINFMTPSDLYGLIRGSSKLLLKLWSDDFKNNNKNFERKIKFVKTIVNNESSVSVRKENNL